MERKKGDGSFEEKNQTRTFGAHHRNGVFGGVPKRGKGRTFKGGGVLGGSERGWRRAEGG